MTKLLEKVFQQRHLAVLLDLVEGDSVEDRLYEPTVIGDYGDPKQMLLIALMFVKRKVSFRLFWTTTQCVYLALNPD